MLFSVITPNYNSGRFLEEAIRSVILQKGEDGIEVEHIIVDGMSTDCSADIIRKYFSELSYVISERDTGPANAINKGLKIASGDVISWLNADDRYLPGAFDRVRKKFKRHPEAILCFGRCPIIDEDGNEIRRFITAFKELFFSVSSLFTIQCINYVSQPAMFFRGSCLSRTGGLREDLEAAWDYEFLLRLWHLGRVVPLMGPSLAEFRWRQDSISGKTFVKQFKEEFEIAASDAGRGSLQSLIHFGVRLGIVSIYSMMTCRMSHDG